MSAVVKCAVCHFWVPDPNDSPIKDGECRHLSPRHIHPSGTQPKGVWPMTRKDQGCAEGWAKEIEDAQPKKSRVDPQPDSQDPPTEDGDALGDVPDNWAELSQASGALGEGDAGPSSG